MARLLFFGACVASIVGGSAAAQTHDRYYEVGSAYSERGGHRSGRSQAPRPSVPYQAPPWSRQYAYQASAGAMWSSRSGHERSWGHEEAFDYSRYDDDRRDYRDCRCAPPYRVRPAEVHVRPGPVYMDRRPVYIEQPPIYIEQPPIYIESPPIYVEGPPVHVQSPPVYVDPPVVHLTPGPVHVTPPEVHVSPGEVIQQAPPPPPTHFGDLPPPGNIPPTAPPPMHDYRQEPGERG